MYCKKCDNEEILTEIEPNHYQCEKCQTIYLLDEDDELWEEQII